MKIELLRVLFLAGCCTGALQAQIRSYDEPVVQTRCGGVPVKRFGATWVYGAAPDLMDDVSFQASNAAPREKVAPRASDRIGFNYVGSCTRLLHDVKRDEFPEQPVHVLDGDVQTCWMSKGAARASSHPVRMRLDLVREATVSRVVLRKRPKNPDARNPACDRMPSTHAVEVGRGIPVDMSLKLSRDAATWSTVFDGATGDTDGKEFFEITFAPQRAKQIMIEGKTLRLVEFFLYAMSVAEVEVYDTQGVNVASVARGTGIAVDSTYHTEGLTRAEMRGIWPTLWDSGMKWVRIGYHDDPVNWHWVEREKGKLEIDPVTDDAITALTDRGIKLVLALGFGNRLYSGPEGRSFPQLCEWNWNMPHPPETEEALAAWDRYVIFMCRHFGDRADTIEIWNEWNISVYFGAKSSYESYARIVERTIPLIRKHAPKARVSLGATSGFPGHRFSVLSEQERLKREEKMEWRILKRFAKDVDVIQFHPFYNPKPGRLLTYTADLRHFKARMRALGFTGTFMPSEWNVNCLYPSPLAKDAPDVWCGTYSPSEMQRAKEIIQVLLRHAGEDMPSMFCEWAGTFYAQTNLSFFRAAFHQDPVTPIQPDASYYALRNLSGMMDGLRPASFDAAVSPQTPGLELFTFAAPDARRAVAVWYEDMQRSDERRQKTVTLTLGFPVKGTLYAYDPFNGVRQKLTVSSRDGKSVVEGLQIGDAPVLIVENP